MDDKRITLGHGSGGRLSHEIYEKLVLKYFGNPALNELDDSALISVGADHRVRPRAQRTRPDIAFSTDSYVVKPIFFPGGDIGKLAVCGTVNDLSVCGAKPLYLSCGMVVEEGFSFADLEKITASMAAECKRAGVKVVAGDFKVVEKGAADGIFINTAGIGKVERKLGIRDVKPGDRVLYLGKVGAHGAAIMLARGNLKIRGDIKSDCRALNRYLLPLLSIHGLRFMRDPTRGGLAGVLCEIAGGAGFSINVSEKALPIAKLVAAVCELTGLDPLYLANEGAAVIVVAEKDVAAVKRKVPAAIIGTVEDEKSGRVYLETVSGGRRILEMLAGEQLPRIC